MSAEVVGQRPAQAQETPRRGGVVIDIARRLHIRAVTRSLRSPGYEETTDTSASAGPSKTARRTAVTVAAVATVGVGLEVAKAFGAPVVAPSDLLPTGKVPNPPVVPTDVGPLPFGNS